MTGDAQRFKNINVTGVFNPGEVGGDIHHINVGSNAQQPTRPPPNSARLLLLTANAPEHGGLLRVDLEAQAVRNAIRSAVSGQEWTVELESAPTVGDVMNALNRVRPQAVHFAGHANPGGILMEDDRHDGGSLVPYDKFSQILSATTEPPALVVLNACFSDTSASALLRAAAAVVGFSAEVSDLGAREFAVAFYAALAAGQGISGALAQGEIQMLRAAPQDPPPTLRHRPGVTVGTFNPLAGA